MKILLLNPPNQGRLQRSEYCSLTTKADNYQIPVDLLLQSGILATEHEVLALDAIVEELSAEVALERIRVIHPDAILALSSILSAESDLEFLRRCKEYTGCRNILMGDIFYHKPELMIRAEGVDAICRQFPAHGLLDYLRGEATPADIVCKRDGQIHVGVLRGGPVSYPVPRYELFPIERYRSPIAKKDPLIPVLMSMGCPMECAYCSLSKVAYRQRPLDEVFEELSRLKELGVPEVFFADMMFNSDLKRAKQFCRSLIEKDLAFSWSCQLRLDRADREILELMYQAGCHTVLFGVESSDSKILEANGRSTDLDQVRRVFKEAKSIGLKTLAFCILGLPGETHESAHRSVDFLLSLDSDYLSVNLFAPRVGSAYMREYRSLGEILAPQPELDSTLTQKSHCDLSDEELLGLRQEAIRKFYLRPALILRHLSRVSSPNEFRKLVTSGLSLILNR